MSISEHEEVELKLVAVGDDPPGTLDAVAELPSLAGYRLGPVTRHLIRDRYWDTRDRALGRRKATLRLREVDGELRFTIKAAGSSSGGLFRRQELELPADRASWDVVRRAVASAGVSLRDPRADASGPVDWLEAAGLIITQDRVTERRVRHVYRGDRALAELALDTTRYRFGDRTSEFREIEVEQLEGAGDVARELGRALLDRFAGRLQPATMGKYSRGLQLERELGTGRDPGAGSQ